MAPYEAVAAACVGALLLAQVLVFVGDGGFRRCLRSLAAAPRKLSALVAAGQGGPRAAAKESLAAQKVAERIALRRVKISRSFLLPLCFLSFWCAGNMLFMLALGVSRWMPAAGDILFVVSYANLLVLSHNPQWLHVGSLSFWFSGLMCLHVVSVSPLAIEVTQLPIMYVLTIGVRLILCLCTRPPLFIFWNAVYMLTVSLHFVASESGPQKGECTGWGDRRTDVVGLEVLSCVVVLTVGFVAKTVMEAEAWQAVQASTSHCGLEAARSLLGTICDAVVELDADLRLVSHSPGLATMLLRSPALSLTGMKLDRYMHSEDDRERLNNHLQVPVHETGAVADAFHLNLRDSCGSVIGAELFHVCFQDCLTGLSQHLVGLREHSDRCEPPAAPQPSLSEQAPLLDFSARRQRSELAVVFDGVTFDVLRTSPAFAARFGACPPGSAVDEWLSAGDVEAFCGRVNGFCNSGAPSCAFDWELQGLWLPQAPDTVVPHRLSCTLTLDSRGDEERVLACIVLVMAQDSARSGTSSGGSSSTQRVGASEELPLAAKQLIVPQLPVC